MKKRMSALLLAFVEVLLVTNMSPVSCRDVAGPVVTTDINAISDAKLLLSGLDGQLVFVEVISGHILWSSSSRSPLLTSSHPSGVGVGSTGQIVMPGIDGSLYFVPDLTSGKLERLEVSIRDIVGAAPFRTNDGTRLVANKHSHVTMIDASTGVVQDRFTPARWDMCDADKGDYRNADTHSKIQPLASDAIWVGKRDYVVRAIDGDSGKLRWNVTFSEISSCIDDHADAAQIIERLPRILASSDGHVWAQHRSNNKVLWTVKLSSVLSRVHLRVGSDIVPLEHTYAPWHPSASASSADFLALKGPVLTRMDDGQVFVVANAGSDGLLVPPSHSPLAPLLLPSPESSPAWESLPALSQQYLPSTPDSEEHQASPPPRPEPVRDDDVLHSTNDDRRRESIHITLHLPEDPVRISFFIFISVLIAMALYRIMSVLGVATVRSRFFRFTPTDDCDSKSSKETSPERSPHHQFDDQSYSKKGLISIGKITIQTRTLLGLGSHGTIVFDGYFEGRSVAVKRLQKHLFMHASKEISLLIDSDRHPHVLRYYAREDDLNFIYVALERCRCSLADLVTGNMASSPLLDEFGCPNPSTRHLLQEMIQGVNYLHSIGIVHRDLKPQNVLVTSENRPKIADMGLSTRLDQDRSSFDSVQVGSRGWHAPETMANGRLTKSVDIFSLGCIVFYTLTGGRHPFGEGYERDSNILQGRFNLRRIEHLPEAVDLVQSMIQHNPQHRSAAAEIVQHPFFWSDEKKLDFLQEVSDRVEVEKPDSLLRLALERQAVRIVTRSWDRVLEAALLDNLGKYRKYNFSSIRDCLRVIRNKKNHYRDLPKDVQRALGPYPSGFLHYFTSRFPSLLLYAHAFSGRYFLADMHRHFEGMSDATLKIRWQVWSCDDDGDEPTPDSQ